MNLAHGLPAFHERVGAGVGISKLLHELGEQATQASVDEAGNVLVHFDFDEVKQEYRKVFIVSSNLFVDDTIPGLPFAPEKTREKTKH